jgi:hypothetical protein
VPIFADTEFFVVCRYKTSNFEKTRLHPAPFENAKSLCNNDLYASFTAPAKISPVS